MILPNTKYYNEIVNVEKRKIEDVEKEITKGTKRTKMTKSSSNK